MPANLSPGYHEADARFRAAKTPEEKIAALEEMLREIPKHKGTEKLQAGLKTRLSKLRHQPGKKGATRGPAHRIPHEGAGQIALIGPPNGGKSSLVNRLTHASPEVAEYPLTTREALPGMMPFEDIAFQLVDLPPLCDEHVEPWVYDLIRQADIAWLVVDEADSVDGVELTRRLLAAKKVDVVPAGAGAEGLEALLVVTRCDLPESGENLAILGELLEGDWPIVSVSAVSGEGLDKLGRKTFEALGIMRVYTKQPGKPADQEAPFTLPIGATVGRLAETIHKDIRDGLRFARIWGPSAFDGQTVHGDHVLQEGDVVEIHV